MLILSQKFLKSETCNCPLNATAKAQTIQFTRDLNRLFEDLARNSKYDKDNFAVVVQPFMKNTRIQVKSA